jgi:hypothetical protein
VWNKGNSRVRKFLPIKALKNSMTFQLNTYSVTLSEARCWRVKLCMAQLAFDLFATNTPYPRTENVIFLSHPWVKPPV